MLSSSSTDSFTPNKRKNKPDTITNWTVSLNDGKLMITGLDKTGKKTLKKECQFRISNYIFYDVNGTVYSLLGYSKNDEDLPKYIENKFKTGIPSDWNDFIQVWKQYKQLGCPMKFQWETNYPSDCTDSESNDKNETIKVLEKKIEEYNKRLRILRKSLLYSSVSSTNTGKKNKLFSSFNSTAGNSNYRQIEAHTNTAYNSSNLFSGNNRTEIISYHKQNEQQNSLIISNSDETEQIDHELLSSSYSAKSFHLYMSSDTPKYKNNNVQYENKENANDSYIFSETASVDNKDRKTIHSNNFSPVVKAPIQNSQHVNESLKNDVLKQTKKGSKFKKSTNINTDQMDVAQNQEPKINNKTSNELETESSKLNESIQVDHKTLQITCHKTEESQSKLFQELSAPKVTEPITNNVDTFSKPCNIVTENKSKLKASETKRKKYNKQNNLTQPNDLNLEKNMSVASRSSMISDSSILSNISISSRGRRRVPVLPYWQGHKLKTCDEDISIEVYSKTCMLNESIQVDHKSTCHKTEESQSKLFQKLSAPVVTEPITNNVDTFLKPSYIVTENKSKLKASETKRKKYNKQNNLTQPNNLNLEYNNMSVASRSSVISDSSILSNTSISSRGRRRVPVLPYWQGHKLKVCDEDISIEVYSKSCNLENYILENSNLSLLTVSKLNNSSAKLNHSKLPEVITSPFKKVKSNMKQLSGSNKKDLYQPVEKINILKISDKIQSSNSTVLKQSQGKKNKNTDTIKTSIMNHSKDGKSKISFMKKIEDDLIKSMSDDFPESSKTPVSKQNNMLEDKKQTSPMKRNGLICKNKTLTKEKVINETAKVHITKQSNHLAEMKSKGENDLSMRKRKSVTSLTNNKCEISSIKSTSTTKNQSSTQVKLIKNMTNNEPKNSDIVSHMENTPEINSPLKKKTKPLPKFTNKPHMNHQNTVNTPIGKTRTALKKINNSIDMLDMKNKNNVNTSTNVTNKTQNHIISAAFVNTKSPIKKNTKYTNIIEFSSSSTISETKQNTVLDYIENDSLQKKTRSAQKKINKIDENKIKNQFKNTKSARKKTTSKIIEANDKISLEDGVNKIKSPLKTFKSNVQNLSSELIQSNPKKLSVAVKAKQSPFQTTTKSASKLLSNDQPVNVKVSVEVNSNKRQLHQNVSVQLFKEDATTTNRRSLRNRPEVDYKEKLFIPAIKSELFTMSPPKTTNLSLPTKTTLKSDKKYLKKNNSNTTTGNKVSKVGPKQTVIFKAPKPKKNQIILPVDPDKLYQNVFITKSKPCIKRVLDTQKPVQNISLNSKAKSRKLFQNNAWVQSTEFNQFMCGGMSESEDSRPSFVLKFNPENLCSELDEEKFSDVSGMF